MRISHTNSSNSFALSDLGFLNGFQNGYPKLILTQFKTNFKFEFYLLLFLRVLTDVAYPVKTYDLQVLDVNKAK